MWKQPKGPSVDEWIKECGVHTQMEYYSALKKKEILPYMTIQMNSEDIMLGEINQSLKDKYCMVPSL